MLLSFIKHVVQLISDNPKLIIWTPRKIKYTNPAVLQCATTTITAFLLILITKTIVTVITAVIDAAGKVCKSGTRRWLAPLKKPFTYLWLVGNEGMEKKMETTI